MACRKCGWLGDIPQAKCQRCGQPDCREPRAVLQLIGWDQLPGSRICIRCWPPYDKETRGSTRPFANLHGPLVWLCPEHYTPSVDWAQFDPFAPEGRGYLLPHERGYTACNAESFGDPPCGGCDSCLARQYDGTGGWR